MASIKQQRITDQMKALDYGTVVYELFRLRNPNFQFKFINEKVEISFCRGIGYSLCDNGRRFNDGTDIHVIMDTVITLEKVLDDDHVTKQFNAYTVNEINELITKYNNHEMSRTMFVHILDRITKNINTLNTINTHLSSSPVQVNPNDNSETNMDVVAEALASGFIGSNNSIQSVSPTSEQQVVDVQEQPVLVEKNDDSNFTLLGENIVVQAREPDTTDNDNDATSHESPNVATDPVVNTSSIATDVTSVQLTTDSVLSTVSETNGIRDIQRRQIVQPPPLPNSKGWFGWNK